MGLFAGLDVSLKETAVCVLEDAGEDLTSVQEWRANWCGNENSWGSASSID